ncbi:hypothetical protein ACLB2K_057833 [Fragaria x ananassa]
MITAPMLTLQDPSALSRKLLPSSESDFSLESSSHHHHPLNRRSCRHVTPSKKQKLLHQGTSLSSHQVLVLIHIVKKKLEAELEETKVELKLLKERESETEVALATLNAELHKNMSKLAQAEAAAAGKAAASSDHHAISSMRSNPEEAERNVKKDPWSMIRMDDSTSLAQILSIGSQHKKQYGYYGTGGKRERNYKMMKKKPIVPLLQDLFSWKKGSSTPLHDHIYSSPKLYY